MKVHQAIKILTDRSWFYEGSTTIDGIRCYIMRKYDWTDESRQSVFYFTTKGLRAQAKKDMQKP